MRKNLLLLLLMVFSLQMMAQTKKISGKIIDSKDNSALPGVTIQNMTSKKGTITDMDGKYTLDAAQGEVLRYTFIGYEPQNVTVGASDEINVSLNIETKGLEEVVVIGYGVQKKSLVTGSIAKVGGDDLIKAGGANVVGAMQGKTAGVQISSNSGQPGDVVSVTIRGIGTNGDSGPLYIIDGMPAAGGYSMDYLNPTDIESIEVLKDAAAGAIYGARAGNGVVLITTKSGKKGSKFEISYDAYYGVQNPWKKIQVLNSDQYMQIQNEAAANAGNALPFPKSSADTLRKINTDWQDQMINKNAPKVSHTITMSGSGDKFNYMSSFNYFKQEGTLAKGHSSYEKYTFRLNVNKEMGFMTITNNLNYAHILNRGIDANGNFGTSLVQALNLPPIIPADPVNGVFKTPDDYHLSMQEITNPNALLSVVNNETNTNKFIGGITASFDFGKINPILEGLKFKSNLTTSLVLGDNRYYTPIYRFSATKFNNIDNTGESINKYYNWDLTNVISYEKNVGDHHITAMLGHEASRAWQEYLSASKNVLIFNDFAHAWIDNATDPKSAQASSGYTGDYALLSYFGRLSYDFGNRYMLNASLRKDGSSNFGPNNKFGYFPSVSLGWVVSRESFFPTTTPINMLKIRGSWGQNGNDRISPFAFTSVVNNSAIYYFGQTPTQVNGIVPNSVANPNIKWEAAEQKDIAIDLGMFSDRVTLTLDYYVKTTKDWLVVPPIFTMTGNHSNFLNAGDVENKGLEFELNLKQKVQDVDINVGITGGFNKNNVVSLSNGLAYISSGYGGFGQNGIIRIQPGQPVSEFYGNQVLGVFQNAQEVNAYTLNGKLIQPNAKPGDFKYADLNGDGVINEADRVALGNPNPTFTGGFNVNVAWKGIDFYASFYTQLGAKAWTALRRYDQTYTNYTMEAYLNRWTGEGSTNSDPRVTASDLNGNYSTPSSYYVHDASYMRLKTLTLGYTLPKNLTQQVKISKLRVYLSGENLLTFTKYPGYEPEMGSGAWDSRGIDTGLYPQPRTILGGINVTF